MSRQLSLFLQGPGHSMIATSVVLGMLIGLYIGLNKGNVLPARANMEKEAWGVLGTIITYLMIGVIQKAVSSPPTHFRAGYNSIGVNNVDVESGTPD